MGVQCYALFFRFFCRGLRAPELGYEHIWQILCFSKGFWVCHLCLYHVFSLFSEVTEVRKSNKTWRQLYFLVKVTFHFLSAGMPLRVPCDTLGRICLHAGFLESGNAPQAPCGTLGWIFLLAGFLESGNAPQAPRGTLGWIFLLASEKPFSKKYKWREGVKGHDAETNAKGGRAKKLIAYCLKNKTSNYFLVEPSESFRTSEKTTWRLGKCKFGKFWKKRTCNLNFHPFQKGIEV